MGPANFYNQVDGALTNAVTVAPGDTIHYLVGINSEGGIDDAAIAMNFDPDLIQVQDADISDEIGLIIPFQILEEVDNEAGSFTFIKVLFGSYFVGSADFMSVNLIISDQITESITTSVNHILEASADYTSSLSLYGTNLLEDYSAPSLWINIQVGTPDCEELGSNIGAACDDGNPLTINDTVTEDCECMGTPVDAPCYPPSLSLALQDADANPILCVNAGGEYYVLASLSGGEGNTTYSLTSPNQSGVAANIDANDSVVLGPFTQGIGNSVQITATGNQNSDCFTEDFIWAPDICHPANNECYSATPLICGEATSGTTVGATMSGINLPYCAPTGAANDVFYTLTVTAGQEYTISIVGPAYDGILLLYRGTSCSNPLLISCVDDGTEGEVESKTFVANLDETIKIRTYDRNGSETTFTITAECEPFDCPTLEANIGDACDDNNPLTASDSINANCECVGIPYDCTDLLANIGDPCDDGNEMTINDAIGEDCTCAGSSPPDGMFCWAPIEVISLPYTTTDNTENYGNNYSSDDLAPLADTAPFNLNGLFLNGNDVVYAYTPSEDGYIDISVTNHASYTGFYVFTGCPFQSTISGSHSPYSTDLLTVQTLPVISGVTYNIVISTAEYIPTTPYTLTITPIFFDCPELQANIGDACDDGDPTTINDTLGQDCLCAGMLPPTGATCDDPIQITSLPFLTTDSTDLYGDDYEVADIPPLAPDAYWLSRPVLYNRQ